MNFSEALTYLRQGEKLARDGWNGKGMFIYYVPANYYPASRNLNGTMDGVFDNDLIPYQPYIAMLTAQKTVVPWLASQTDLLSNDWDIAP